ncbi:glycosyl transferase family 90-domain-containing protein [Xylaria digitata]|nr:glycosyl transferase family 90-domain-containing protein [Xylaria digitata]
MSRNQSTRARKLWISLASFLLLYLGRLARSRRAENAQSIPADPSPSDLFQFLNLNEQQCKATFPDLTQDLDATVALGPFTLKRAQGTGPLQARIKDGQLYIIHSGDADGLSPELLQARQAALYQIHRAIITSPEKLPDTIFSLNIRDQPYGTAWSYSRPAYAAPAAATPPLIRAFLMPHFAFWNWPLPFIGSISRAGAAISQIEESLPFRQKDARVVWRGSARFNGAHNPTLRQDLLRATAGATWADVRALESYEGNATAIEDFCRYKYVLYTDGVTYSGRLSFLQMCDSVLLAPSLAWRQLTTHLLRPVFFSDLLADKSTTALTDREERSGKSGDMRWAWPAHRPEDANAVFVAPDWSDLDTTVSWLEEHPDVAEGIAKRQRDLFVGKGYTSPAMETCYWRALIRGWSQVVRLGEGWENTDGVSWEEYSLDWDGMV